MAGKATFAARRSAVRKMLVQGGYSKAAEADDERLIKLLGLMAFKVEEEPDTLNELSDGANKLFERFVTVLEAAGDDTDNIEFAFRDDDEEEADAKPAKKDELEERPAKKAPKDEGEDEDVKPAKKSQAKDEDEEDRPAKKPQAKDEDEDGEGQPKRGRGRPKLSEEEKAARAAAKSAKPSDNEDVAAGEPAEKQAAPNKSASPATHARVGEAIADLITSGRRIKFTPGRNQAYLAGVVLRAHLEDCAAGGEITDDAAEALLCLIGDCSEEMGHTGAKRLLLVIAHALRGFTGKASAKTEIDYLKSLGVQVPKEIASKLLGD